MRVRRTDRCSGSPPCPPPSTSTPSVGRADHTRCPGRPPPPRRCRWSPS
ncbi:MAG: hypothetical protein ACK56F_31290 [bacterium]